MGIRDTIRERGYGFFAPNKVSWSAWQFKSGVKEHILYGLHQFRKSYTHAYQKVIHASEFDANCHELLDWLSELFANTPIPNSSTTRALQVIWKWLCENLVWEFQKEILEAAESDIRPRFVPANGWKINDVLFSIQPLTRILRDDIQLVAFISNGRAIPKSTLERLDHLWNFEDGLHRLSWEKKSYRLIYQKICKLWNTRLAKFGWFWSHQEFYKFFIRRCTIWPNATTGKWFPMKKMRRVWYIVGDINFNVNNPSSWKIGSHDSYVEAILPLSGIWIGKNAITIQEYINLYSSHEAQWRDLARIYQWEWGPDTDYIPCSVNGNTSTLAEPKYNILSQY